MKFSLDIADSYGTMEETTMVTDVEIWDLVKLMLNIGAMCLFIDLARKFAGKK